MGEEEKIWMERVNGIAMAMLDRLETAVKELDAVIVTRREKNKTGEGEAEWKYEEKLPRKKGVVDRGGLKQLTSVLKDLEEILLCMPQLEAKEQRARLDRLERELQEVSDGARIAVKLEGETESYAG